MDISYNKSQVLPYDATKWNAQDAMEVKDAVNSKVDKVAGKSLISDDEILRLSGVTNQDISGKADASAVYTKSQSDAKYLSSGTTLFSGNYNDLTNKPVIPSISGLASESWVLAKNYISGVTWNDVTSKPALFSGSYSDLTGKPNLNVYLTGVTWADVAGKPSFFDGDYNSLTNKPVIPSINGLATTGYVDGEVLVLQNQIDELSSGGADLTNYYTKSQSDEKYLSTGTTLFDGDYDSLINKPTIPSLAGYATESFVTGKGFLTGVTWNDVAGKPMLFSGSYNDLTDKPSIPSISGLTTQTYVDGQIDNLQVQIDEISSGGADLTNYYTKEQANNTFISTATTLFSGSYSDLSNKPSLFSGAYSDLSGKPNLNVYLTAVTWSDVSGKPSFATVATSGSYNDLSNTPSIPVITGLTTKVYVDNGLAGKVDKDGSKVLTDNNYSTTEKSKLASIASGATVNSTDVTLLNRANHTGSMPASGLTQTSSARLVTDTEKSTWSGKQDALGFTAVPTTRTVAGKALSSNITLAKGDVGLGNIDNTSDANKPVSTATQTALNLKANSADAISNSTDTFGAKVTNIVSCTQAEYNGLTPNSTTFYIII